MGKVMQSLLGPSADWSALGFSEQGEAMTGSVLASRPAPAQGSQAKSRARPWATRMSSVRQQRAANTRHGSGLVVIAAGLKLSRDAGIFLQIPRGCQKPRQQQIKKPHESEQVCFALLKHGKPANNRDVFLLQQPCF